MIGRVFLVGKGKGERERVRGGGDGCGVKCNRLIYYEFYFSGLFSLYSLAPLAVAVESRGIALCSVLEGEEERVELHG